MDKITKDERFAHISKDPRFRTMPKKMKKVKIDDRFKTMFTDKRFKMKYTLDKRGRPVNHSTNENLRKYYDLSESDSDSKSDEGFQNDSSDEESALIAKIQQKAGKCKQSTKDNKVNCDKVNDSNTSHTKKKSRIKQNSNKNLTIVKEGNSTKTEGKAKINQNDTSETSDEESSSSSGESSDEVTLNVGDGEPDYARGEGLVESSTEDEDDDDEEIEDEFDHDWNELDKDVPQTDELSCRIAVCNMDWDRMNAEDIFVLLNSFKPPKGVIKSVCIYPSEFGQQRMKEESINGPVELKVSATDGEEQSNEESSSDANSESEDEDSADNSYNHEKLRKYQLNRLKYYYAVVECDSIETARKIYDECDGMEYRTTAARIDLRFIPDNMTFDQVAKSECTSLPDASTYKPPSFLTTALCQTKVNLTWDETDQDRVKLTMRKFDRNKEVNEDDFKAYLASSSEDEGPGFDDVLAGPDDSAEQSDEETQIEKYKSLLKEIDESANKKGDMEMEIEWEPELKDATEDIIKSKEKSKEMTPWEQYQEKKKEKKKQKREERKKKSLQDTAAGSEKTFSDDELPEDIDMTDSYFAEELRGKSKPSEKKGKKKKSHEEEDPENVKEKAELSLLLMDEKEDGRQHFNLGDLVEKKKKKKKKGKKLEEVKQTDDDFEVDLKDPRFDAVYKSHLFNIDPSAPEFKNTKGMDALIQEKLKRRMEDGHSNQKKIKKDPVHDDVAPREQSLSSLLNSVKAKTQQFQSKKKKK